MRKIPILLCTILMIVGFTSCEYITVKEDITIETNSKTLNLSVTPSIWQWSEAGYWFCGFEVPELTQEIYDYGVVSCYREFNMGTANAYQIALPHVFTTTDGTDIWTQTIDMSFMVGYVEIVLTNSDLKYSDQAPEAMDFRLNMVW